MQQHNIVGILGPRCLIELKSSYITDQDHPRLAPHLPHVTSEQQPSLLITSQNLRRYAMALSSQASDLFRTWMVIVSRFRYALYLRHELCRFYNRRNYTNDHYLDEKVTEPSYRRLNRRKV